MKRIILLFFALTIVLSMCACKSSQNDYSVPDYGTMAEYTAGDTFTVGNYTMTVPEGFAANYSSNHYFLFSLNSGCSISIFATDLSMLDEAYVRQYVASQSKVFLDEEATRYSEKTQEIRFGQLTLVFDMYAEETPDGMATIHTNGSFTDSWYGYTVTIQCAAGSDKISDDFYTFAEFCYSAEYIGDEPRFDFVQ